ncbi:MAG: PAS domain-containing protein [Acidobacteriaceae bacterium]|nr:PAS domain-containing protein [Acidobacteriaceae bacterium]MBV9766982.1 PAS domain-containing protein [Acidobacteriaceae bacterium]
MAKFIGAWCLLMLSAPLAMLWLWPNFNPGATTNAIVKLCVLLGFVCAAALAFTYSLERKWSRSARRLEDFASALPAIQTDLPDDGLAELRSLSRAMQAMSGRIRQVVERAGLESSRRETILACMAEGVLAVDTSLKVIFCNDAFARAFDSRTPVMQGRPLYELVREPLLREVLERVLQTGNAEKDRFQLPSAAGRWFEARALPLGENPRRGAVIVLHDVTDIHRQEEVRKDFVADVSHELRTPLAAIRGYAETLLDGALEDQANNRKFVEIIASHAIRLNNIASDLLVISELDSNPSLPWPPERVPVLEVIDSATHTVQEAAATRGVHLKRVNCTECSATGYRFRLEQAIVNLLDNAVKFNRPDGEVTIECGYANEDRVQVSISDTGIGIPSEDLKRIFDRFYRVDRARSRGTGGTGLGLAIVKEVVEGMGGSVSAESQLGRGSKFTILLQAA